MFRIVRRTFITKKIIGNQSLTSDAILSSNVFITNCQHNNGLPIAIEKSIPKENLFVLHDDTELHSSAENIENGIFGNNLIYKSSILKDMKPDDFFEAFGDMTIRDISSDQPITTTSELMKSLTCFSDWIYMKNNYNCNIKIESSSCDEILSEKLSQFMSQGIC